MDQREQYWATLAPEQLLPELVRRRDDYYDYLRSSGRLDLWRTALREYYAGSETGGKTGTAGEQDEYTTIKVNHVHNLGEHLVTAIAGQPPHFQPQALNNDSESTSQTVVASGLLETAVTQKGLEPVSVTVTRLAEVLGEGYGMAAWDQAKGEDYAADPTTGQIVKTGDVIYRSFTPDSVVRDVTRMTAADPAWVQVRVPVSRWDLMAEYPQQAEQIKAVPSTIDDEAQRPKLTEDDSARQYDCDEVWKWEFYHARTPSLPSGRRVCYVGDNILLADEPLPYREIPVYRMAPEEQIGTAHGYTTVFDILPMQSAINSTYSIVLSNHNTLGTPVIWVKPGSDVSHEDMGGFALLKTNEKPEAITLAQTPAEIPAFAQNLIQQAEIISGVNSVRRGNIEATGKLSGAAYALIDAKFLEYAAGLQKAYKIWMSKMATATVHLYRDFAKAEFTTAIVGKSNRVQVKRFTGTDLQRVARVDIELGNPLQRTVSGRLQLVQMLFDMQLLKTPEQVFQVITSGRLEPATEGTAKELDNVKAENEILSDGQVPVAWIYDNHPLHIQEHSGVMSSPEARQNPALSEAVLAHIAEHLTQWQTAPLDGLAARGIPPPPAPMGVSNAMMTGMAAPGPTTGTPPPQQGEPSATPAPNMAPPGAGPQPGMPNMPTNPGTGEPAPGPAMA